MFYAMIFTEPDATPATRDGAPDNFTVRAFATKTERQGTIDAAWSTGGNGLKVTRESVIRLYGRAFVVDSQGLVHASEMAMQDAEEQYAAA